MSNLRPAKPAADHGNGPITLPPELLAEASQRLGLLGLIYAGAYFLAQVGWHLVIALRGSRYVVGPLQDAVAIGAVAMGLAVYWVSRRSLFSPQRLLDLGLVFQVAGAFGITINEFWQGFLPEPSGPYIGVPWECIWILIFPLVVPNTPHKILIASLLAASTGPVTVALAGAVSGGNYIGRPLVFATYFLISNYLCAVIAYVVSHIVYRYGVRLKRAREIGSYELLQKLGEGGMGEVWQARHRLLARPAAIKLIRGDVLGPNPRSRETAVRRFEREARATATLGSTHTVGVYDFGATEDGDFYYVMELLNGMSLETYVQRFGPVEPARVVYWLHQVCHSLGEAHGRGLIHRDIKPANIFVCQLGPDYDFVKVLDFGLVKHVEGFAPATMLTMEAVTAGTPSYMAPEVALGQRGLDGRVDLYALGCVAYFLLTGQQVFAGDSAVATVVAHIRDTPVPPSARAEVEIPHALEALVLDCLAKDPAGRPASAEALAARLSTSVPGEPWTAEAARAWWDLHQVSMAAFSTAPDVEEHAEAGSGVEPPRQRCWPRIDRSAAH